MFVWGTLSFCNPGWSRLNSLCSLDLPQTHRNSPASASQVLRLQAWANVRSSVLYYFRGCFRVVVFLFTLYFVFKRYYTTSHVQPKNRKQSWQEDTACCPSVKVWVQIPRSHVKSGCGYAHAMCVCGGRQWDLCQPSSRFSERLYLKGIRQKVIEQDTWCLLWPVYTHAHKRAPPTLLHTPKNIFNFVTIEKRWVWSLFTEWTISRFLCCIYYSGRFLLCLQLQPSLPLLYLHSFLTLSVLDWINNSFIEAIKYIT